MRKMPIDFKEKVYARFTKKSKGVCWVWEGGTQRGRPSLNNRFVMRYIYEQERGPIPPGHTLWRLDHTRSCVPYEKNCKHMLCVNPWHVEPRNIPYGIYPRERSWPVDGTDHINEYKRLHRKKGPGRKSRNGDDGDQKGLYADRADGAAEGLRLEESDISEQGDP